MASDRTHASLRRRVSRLASTLEETRDPARAAILGRRIVSLEIDFDTLLLTAQEIENRHPAVALDLYASVLTRDSACTRRSFILAGEAFVRIAGGLGDAGRLSTILPLLRANAHKDPSLQQSLADLRADPRFIHLFAD